MKIIQMFCAAAICFCANGADDGIDAINVTYTDQRDGAGVGRREINFNIPQGANQQELEQIYIMIDEYQRGNLRLNDIRAALNNFGQ